MEGQALSRTDTTERFQMGMFDPRETRKTVIRKLAAAKRVERPPAQYGVMPV